MQPLTTGKHAQVYSQWYSSFLGLFGTLQYQRRCYSTTQKALKSKPSVTEQEREEIITWYRAPKWLVNRAWRIQATKEVSGWTFRPRTMNTVPEDSALFKFARRGDVKSLQELFSRYEVSPFDRDISDWTALKVRITFRKRIKT